MIFGGLQIHPHPFAVRIVHKVERHPIRKRRRNYRVVREEQPACLQMGNVLFMHPALIAKLPGRASIEGVGKDG